MTLSFEALLGNSPFKPIQEHIRCAAAIKTSLVELLKCAQRSDWQAAQTQLVHLLDHTKQSQQLLTASLSHLSNSLFMPVARVDILATLDAQADLIRQMRVMAIQVAERQTTIPSSAPAFADLITLTSDTIDRAALAVEELDDLLETGFFGREVVKIGNLIKAIADCDDQIDDVERSLIREIRSIEATVSPLDALFLYQLVEQIASLAHDARRIGDCLQLMLAK